MARRFNLSRRPFVATRPPNLTAGILAVLVLGVGLDRAGGDQRLIVGAERIGRGGQHGSPHGTGSFRAPAPGGLFLVSAEAARADHYDFVVVTTRYNLDLQVYPVAKVIYGIERDGSLLTVIKKP